MPLVQCPDCDKTVSDSAISCPNCGRPIKAKDDSFSVKSGVQKAKANYEIGQAIALLGIIISIIVGLAYGSLILGLGITVASIVLGIFIQYQK